MAKNLKLNIKNKQLAEALNLDSLKSKLLKKKDDEEEEKKPKKKVSSKTTAKEKKTKETAKEKAPKKTAAKKTEAEVEKPEEKVEKVEEKPAVKAPTPVKEHKKAEPEKVKKVAEYKKPSSTSTKAPKKIDKRPHQPQADDKKEKRHSKSPFKKGGGNDLFQLGKTSKQYYDLTPLKKQQQAAAFDSRSRHGLATVDEGNWQRRRRRGPKKQRNFEEDTTIRPSELHIRLPITIKNLAANMKVKASELLSLLFKQGLALTLNDALDDETTVQLIGHEMNCEITIDTAEQERIQITDKSLEEEVKASDQKELKSRPPVVTFMGHVDHGKTSLIDAIRKSNRVAYEAGAITQHIGAFQCSTSHGPITVLDTPGHEAFSAMRSRGANVTDLVVLVVAGDEGIKDQTIEALQQAKEAAVTILVAINKCDKENFDPEPVYRGLSDHGLLPEAWGGDTIMVNCSAKTGQGVSELLELVALQSEVLELKANPTMRARGTVLESEVHKGMGNVATVLVQNGTLNVGDSLVFDHHYAKIKTMINDLGKDVQHASPAMPVEITGISGLPEAGSEFIVVKDEKEAKDISALRSHEHKLQKMGSKKAKMQENFLIGTSDQIKKKLLHLIIRADVQGSLEAVIHSLKKIKSDKIEVDVISQGIGEVTESDIQLAKTSNACIIGFHTRIESHAEELMKSINVQIKMPKVIYEAVDQVKELMIAKLDKVPQEEERGSAEVKAVFKASRIGKIAGSAVTKGHISRNQKCRVFRDGEIVYKGSISSLKREKEDVKEVKKGFECGIVLDNFNDVQVGDMIETFDVTYLTQTL